MARLRTYLCGNDLDMAVHPSIADIRKSYQKKTLSEKDVAKDPVDQFKQWWEEAIAANADEVNAMTLATSDKDGRPSARTVLLKGIEDDGFVFFTNYESRKGREIEANPYVALLFFWKELERQVRIEGAIAKLSGEESDKYFVSRPVESRIGAWVSPQSTVISGREFLEERERQFEQKFENIEIPRPPHWGGYSVKPTMMEFWQGRPGRLHDRILYTKEGKAWRMQRLAP